MAVGRPAVAAAVPAPSTDPATAEGSVGTMAQGGFDRDHWWFKISRVELVTIGAGAACSAVFRGPVGAFVCPPLVAALNWAIGQFPVANGFWGEVYTNGRVRVGTY